MLKAAWYHNSYVTAYWEIEDAAVDVYEMALEPIVILGGILAVYLLVVAAGVGFVLLGHLLLRGIAQASGDSTFAPYSNYTLTGTLELSSIGAAIFALPSMFAWKYIPTDPRWGKSGVVLNSLSKIMLALVYGAFSGATGSAILLAALPLNIGVLPAGLATVAGLLGGLAVSPPFVLIILFLLYLQRKRCMVPPRTLAPTHRSTV
jgi:hypothetical protein